jgi:hypothetical protein
VEPLYSKVAVYLKELKNLLVASITIENDSTEICSKQGLPGYKVRRIIS